MKLTSNLRTLVTGGAGFIGSHLVQALACAGARVTVFDNLQAGSWENVREKQKAESRKQKLEGGGQVRGQKSEDRSQRAEVGGQWSESRNQKSEIKNQKSKAVDCVAGDVCDAAAVAAVLNDTKPELVFHLAANASVPGSVEDPAYDFESNALGTFRVLEALRAAGSEARFVLTSSGAVYGEPTVFPIVETSPLAPISPYGASKLAAEVVARMMHKVYGLNVTIARLFNTYGPRMPRFVVLDFLRKLDADPDRLEILGTGRQVRDLNEVSDTVQGLLTIARRGVAGESYNVASGVSCTVTELAEKLLGVLGLIGRTRLAFTGESWPGDAQHWEVDIGKLRALGYAPRVGMEEGLERVVRWFAGGGEMNDE